ncbi:MAG: hypothetical protein WCF99_00655 [Chloroflexales bacterium]
MGTSRPQHTVEQEAESLMATIAAQDAQIAQLEAELVELPALLARLAGHPVLWLLLGREGIDRPGGDWSLLVGQQVVPVPRTNWRLLAGIGMAMLVFGIVLGFVLARWW